MKEKRILMVGYLCSVMLLGLIVRLIDIQLIGTESFSKRHVNLIKESIRQRSEELILNDGRGNFLDRNGDPIRQKQSLGLVLSPFLKQSNRSYRQIAQILGKEPSLLKKAVEKSNSPFVFSRDLSKHQSAAIRQLHVPGVYAGPVQSKKFNTFAEHLLGFVAENPKLVREQYPNEIRSHEIKPNAKIGVSGLEEAFDPFLHSKGTDKLVYYTKADGSPLFGHHLQLKGEENPFYPLNVRTTLDYQMQKIVERAIDQSGMIQGGAILLDAKNSDLLAMVSRPLYHSQFPFRYGGKNYMILPQIPGSIFKLVTAAAAIETNQIDRNRFYDCNLTVYGKKGAVRKLGFLSFSKSFAESCNRTFAVKAVELIQKDPHYMEKYAGKLGLVGPVGWKDSVNQKRLLRQFPNEVAGSIWQNQSFKNNPKSVEQTAIGQLSVRVSPLAVANAMATIARGGKKLAVRAATEVDYANGIKMLGFAEKKLPGGKLTPYTAMKLQEYLSKVVENSKGTGHSLNNLPYQVAGKSGTAETGKGTDNHWFAGYFPASNPKYVLAVVDLDSQTGGTKTYEIYKQVVKQLYQLDKGKPARHKN